MKMDYMAKQLSLQIPEKLKFGLHGKTFVFANSSEVENCRSSYLGKRKVGDRIAGWLPFW